MLKTTAIAGILASTLAISTAGPATSQDLGGLLKDRLACELTKSCNKKPKRGNSQNQMSDIEKALMVTQLTSTLNNARRPVSPSADQAQLYDYSDNYRLQGAATGAIIGAVVACLVADYLLDSSCSKGAIFGAVAGGAVGVYVGGRIGERQNVYRDREVALNTKLQTARTDLADAQSARIAAERLAQSHRQKLSQLQSDYKRTGRNKSEYERQIGYATKDLEAMNASKRGLDEQIKVLETEISNSRPSEAELAESRGIIASLKSESQRLSQAMQSLSGTIESARV